MGRSYLDEKKQMKAGANLVRVQCPVKNMDIPMHSNVTRKKLHIEPVLHEHWRALHDVEIAPQLIKLNLKPEENLAGVQ